MLLTLRITENPSFHLDDYPPDLCPWRLLRGCSYSDNPCWPSLEGMIVTVSVWVEDSRDTVRAVEWLGQLNLNDSLWTFRRCEQLQLDLKWSTTLPAWKPTLSMAPTDIFSLPLEITQEIGRVCSLFTAAQRQSAFQTISDPQNL